jgi:hypothetical protein
VREDSPNPFRKEACPGLHAAWEAGFQAYLSGRAVPERHLKSPSEASNAWLNGYTAARLSGRPSAEQAASEAEGSTESQGAPQGHLQGRDDPEARTDATAAHPTATDATATDMSAGLAPCAAGESLEVSVTDTAVAKAHPEEEALSEEDSLLEQLTPVEREGARYGYRQAGRPFGTTRRGLEIWLRLRARERAD